MKNEDEDSRSDPARNTNNVGNCVKCGTSYTSHVEFVQHLLLHIERFYCRVRLDPNEVESYLASVGKTSANSAAMETEEPVQEKPPTEAVQHEEEEDEEDVDDPDKGSSSPERDVPKPPTVNGEKDQKPVVPPVESHSAASLPNIKKEPSAINDDNTNDDNEKDSVASLNGDDTKSTGSACKPESEAGDESPNTRPSSASLPGITIRKFEDLIGDSKYKLIEDCAAESQNGEFPGKDFFTCPLCPQRFYSQAELEAHAAAAGHIVCTLSNACANLSFDSPAALAAHQQATHPDANRAPTNAVQQLAAQVDRLPQTFNQYLPQQQFTPTFNAPKLGSGVVLAPASAMAPAPSQIPNLPSGIQIMKRPAQEPIPEVSPNKAPRSENGGSPRFRIPDSITLVKGNQPQPSLSSAVANTANQLASRGITMMASGSRQNPQGPPTASATIQPLNNSPAKRLPAGISIVPSRSPTQPAQQQRFQPTSPVNRVQVGRPSATVDLTKDDANSPLRTAPRGRPPMMAPAPPVRRVSCTICDKVFPSNEALNQHMVVHGRGGMAPQAQQRFTCPVCQVSYMSEVKLMQHKRTSGHGLTRQQMAQPTPSQDFAIPIVDLNQPGVRERLLNCGIRHSIKLSTLRNSNNTGVFGIPIIPIDLAQNEAFSRLEDLGASNLLSLGPLQPINTPRR
ncbi:ZnF_C2H2 [Nesidiocoris tenuis]|uniref:ZnF_C2H2 n=1 Tax=Nesidiocoris tenuis TaxID=355587 RepID=A0ABN7B7X9_9HEMI|nr:ZnF_C2H2 [Nesidiocoris tenuis]